MFTNINHLSLHQPTEELVVDGSSLLIFRAFSKA